MKILLLEDNKKLNETITKRLKLKGYKVSSFTDGLEALENIDEGFSCYILDINVPNMDGTKILQRIRKIYKNLPVIIISSSVELETIKDAYKFGCNDFLKKPFFIDELEIKIEKFCKIDDNKIYFDNNSFFDFNSSIAKIQNKETRLTRKEKLLLNILLVNKNKLVSYSTIENYVWQGSFVSLESIRSLIRRLRKILEKDYIKTIVDNGYIFEEK
ncbi:MAG: DNA-binding response regulator [Proteobacteria bacterium]|nr:MAG: DNA-binding response regulator [Pseudomonadota bacterium]